MCFLFVVRQGERFAAAGAVSFVPFLPLLLLVSSLTHTAGCSGCERFAGWLGGLVWPWASLHLLFARVMLEKGAASFLPVQRILVCVFVNCVTDDTVVRSW
eukprot:RCo048035